MSCRLLVLGAFGPEVDLLQAPEGLRSACVFGVCGVGIAQAAANTALLIQEHSPEQILFVGSVGSVDEVVPMMTLISASSVHLGDLALARKEAYLPPPVKTRFESHPLGLNRIVHALLRTVMTGEVYSSGSISASQEVARDLQEFSEASFENLELYGLATACALKNVPWNSLSAVTNYVGPKGHEEWLQNFRNAAEMTAEAFEMVVPRLLE